METSDLKEVFSKAYKHLAVKDPEDLYKSFILDKNKIVAVNRNYGVEFPFEIGIQAMIPAEETMKIISGIESEKIILSSGKSSVILKSSGISGEISCFEWDGKYLETYNPKNPKWEKVPEDFNKGIKLSMFSASKDISSESFNAVYVKGNHIQSTDNFRISRYSMKEKMKSFLLPLPSSIAISSQNTINYFLEENLVHFKNKDKSIFHCRLIDGEKFPDVSPFFEIKKKDNFNLPQELSKTISLVSVLAQGDFVMDKVIKVSIDKGVIKCRAENETGWIESNIKIKTDKKILFFINPVFFLEILKLSSVASTDGKKIIFSVDNFSHLMMLIEEKK